MEGYKQQKIKGGILHSTSAPEDSVCAPQIVRLWDHLYGFPSVASHHPSAPRARSPREQDGVVALPWHTNMWISEPDGEFWAHRAARMTHLCSDLCRAKSSFITSSCLPTHLLWVGDGWVCPLRVLVLEAWAQCLDVEVVGTLRGGSVGKGTHHQAWQPEFHSWTHIMKERTDSRSRLLTSRRESLFPQSTKCNLKKLKRVRSD